MFLKHIYSPRMTKIKTDWQHQILSKVWGIQNLRIADGNAKWYNPCGKSSGNKTKYTPNL